jgi:glycosyltransferase involved in cell wall biosynthesis
MNKVFEYSALGIPSVAYPLTETRRLLGTAGVYAENDTPAALAGACLELIENNELHDRCAREATRLAQRSFSWEREANKLVAAYERLASPPAAQVTPLRIGRKH